MSSVRPRLSTRRKTGTRRRKAQTRCLSEEPAGEGLAWGRRWPGPSPEDGCGFKGKRRAALQQDERRAPPEEGVCCIDPDHSPVCRRAFQSGHVTPLKEPEWLLKAMCGSCVL